MMRRRQFLAATGTALTVALAGCSEPPHVELRLTPLHDAELGEQLVADVDDLYEDEASAAVRGAAENGSYVRNATDESGPLLDDGELVRHDGEVFAVRTVRVGVQARTLQVFTVTYTGRGDETTVELGDDARIVAYSDLPTADRRMFDDAYPESLAREPGAMARYLRLTYPDDAESVFVPEQEYDAVEYEGRTFQVEYEGEDVVENGRYRYELEPVAPDIETYVDRVVDEHVFTLDRSTLSEEQREMVATAIDESTYEEEKEISDAFAALVERIREHEPVDRHSSQLNYVLNYDGMTYLAELHDTDFDFDSETTEPYRTTTDDEPATGTTVDDSTATNGSGTVDGIDHNAEYPTTEPYRTTPSG
ncbi:hypothetical protein [Haloarchaeobius sp. FL176]|uniref:hypothetical protein n=1 Tax=Haloarchaeobius sp. FL176 TaxID=2967129 RepID=UPI002148A619|nr:hypothetical protein [Haloarchaeobius sp. FL176]